MTAQGEWSLAPAYDVCYAYSPSGKWTNRHQLSLNGKRDEFTMNDLLVIAEKADIINAPKIVREIIEIVSQWEYYAKEAEVTPEYAQQIKTALRLKL